MTENKRFTRMNTAGWNNRYFKRDYEEEYYIFDSSKITEAEIDDLIECEGYTAMSNSMQGDTVVDTLNCLYGQYKGLKLQNKKLCDNLFDLKVDINEVLQKFYDSNNSRKQDIEDREDIGYWNGINEAIKYIAYALGVELL